MAEKVFKNLPPVNKSFSRERIEETLSHMRSALEKAKAKNDEHAIRIFTRDVKNIEDMLVEYDACERKEKPRPRSVNRKGNT